MTKHIVDIFEGEPKKMPSNDKDMDHRWKIRNRSTSKYNNYDIFHCEDDVNERLLKEAAIILSSFSFNCKRMYVIPHVKVADAI